MKQRIIFYDGECPLCQRAIRFILKHDRKKKFLFAPLQGQTAKEKLKALHLHRPDLDTLVLYIKEGEKEKTYIEGKAVILILGELGGFYSIFKIFSLLPSFFIDALYRLISKRRYFLFSKKVSIIKNNYPDRFLN